LITVLLKVFKIINLQVSKHVHRLLVCRTISDCNIGTSLAILCLEGDDGVLEVGQEPGSCIKLDHQSLLIQNIPNTFNSFSFKFLVITFLTLFRTFDRTHFVIV
jgi:hypothetical protein